MLPDYDFYLNTYLSGDTPRVEGENTFNRLALRAWNVINWRGFDDNYSDGLTENDRKRLFMAICAAAEFELDKENVPKSGDIVSESNAGYNYSIRHTDNSVKEIAENQRASAAQWLNTPVLHNDFIYRGVG
jgi:hypothetical protein